MAQRCPGCGTTTVPEARFCRLCGTPLHPGRARADETPVSPLAQTIPLTGEGRTTDGLGVDEARDTTRVGHAEVEDLLRRASAPADAKPSVDGDAAPEKNGAQTTTLTAPDSVPESAKNKPAPPNTASRRWWQAAAVALLCVAFVAAVLAFVLSRRSGPAAEDGSSPISISDQQQLVSEKLAEAETLLASGEFNRAVEVLRSAAKLSPANAEVRIRLGNALERTGARDEAIAEYKAAAESSPENEAAWRALASAQFEEKLYSEAADSYGRALALSGDADAETQLAHADSLRLAGRTDEARTVYQNIYRTYGQTSPEVARAARTRLAEIGPAPSPSANAEPQRPRAEEQEQEERGTQVAQSTPTPQPAPTVAPTQTPAVTAEPRVDYDSYYFQAVNIVNGREPRQIERAELLRALALFQKAALGGSHRIEAQRYADRLGKEYDRRRKL